MGMRCYCGTEHRRALVRTTKDPSGNLIVNGIDYLEVQGTTLQVHFVNDLVEPLSLKQENIKIEGGVRIKGIHAIDTATLDKSNNKLLIVPISGVGDSSTYTLRLVNPKNPQNKVAPPDGFDPLLSAVDFVFNVDRISEFDCRTPSVIPPETYLEPQIDYLAKDYDSFRRLMLDRLSILTPDWQERNPADLQVALVELLAYVGDQLSYYQDAVASEAYLGTAHQRISVHRHARLLDYPMHDGCNARIWVALEVDESANGRILPGPNEATHEKESHPGTRFLTKGSTVLPCVLKEEQISSAVSESAQVFESMHDITLFKAHNAIPFYTWGEEQCCLPNGTTTAFLQDDNLHLEVGKVLIFEEQFDPSTGKKVSADPAHRHAIRLTRADAGLDKVTGQSYVEIEWDAEDALPFSLCIGWINDPTKMPSRQPITVALGNIVLADHGLTVLDDSEENLITIGAKPYLKFGPITQQGQIRERRYRNGKRYLTDRWLPFDSSAPASKVFQWNMRDVMPAVKLVPKRDANEEIQPWTPRHDLLSSNSFDPHFVVEIDGNGRAWLRFGDGVQGQRPDPGAQFKPICRTGNGVSGNVGGEMVAHIVTDVGGIINVCNPMPAQGGCDPEPIEQVCLYAPQAFRTQERAVTPADYQYFAELHPEVQKAVATFQWTGSWYTVFLSIDRLGGREVDDHFRQEMIDYLEKYRLAGFDLEVNGPQFVPLKLTLTVNAKPGYYPSNLRQALLDTFSNRDLPGGKHGFFHPDNFTFGQQVYLSQIYQAALQVAGVESVQVDLRFWANQDGSSKEDCLTVDRLQIVRLDNDPNLPENGKIEIIWN